MTPDEQTDLVVQAILEYRRRRRSGDERARALDQARLVVEEATKGEVETLRSELSDRLAVALVGPNEGGPGLEPTPELCSVCHQWSSQPGPMPICAHCSEVRVAGHEYSDEELKYAAWHQ